MVECTIAKWQELGYIDHTAQSLTAYKELRPYTLAFSSKFQNMQLGSSVKDWIFNSSNLRFKEQ